VSAESFVSSLGETHQMLKRAFGHDSLGQTQTYDWYKRFRNGRASTDDDGRSGRPSTGTTPENVAKVRDLILQDRPSWSDSQERVLSRYSKAFEGGHEEETSREVANERLGNANLIISFFD
jgi:hypothetical protein